MDLTLIIIGGILLGCLIGLSWFAGSDAPFVPTKMDFIKQILKIAGVKSGKRFYELGSGDGRVVIAAAKLGSEATGIEQSWIRVLYARWRTHSLALHLKGVNVNFYHNNIFNRTYQNADIVYIYLLQKAVDKLEGKLQKELKKGAVVITQKYHFPNWQPYKKMGNFWIYSKT